MNTLKKNTSRNLLGSRSVGFPSIPTLSLFRFFQYSIFNIRHSPQKGFTIVELLVVTAIIGVLSTVVVAALSSVREKARDSMRKTQLVELQKAITHYYTQTGAYPTTNGAWLSSEVGDECGGGCAYSATYIPNIVTANLIPSLPKDPMGGINLADCAGTQHRAYVYNSNGQHYKLLSNCSLENDSYPSVGSQFYDPARALPFPWALQVTDSIEATGTGCPGNPTTCW